MSMHRSTIFRICTLFCLPFSSTLAHAQAPEITQARAGRILSAYLQAPDTHLTAVPSQSSTLHGHTEYVFDGDHGGAYRIDAATLEKAIHYAGLSAADRNATTTANHLSETQLKANATRFVAQHFPGYVPGKLQIDAPPIDPETDADEYYVSFDAVAASGADLPQHCLVILEEDTGKVKAYDETAIPVTVSTLPLLTSDQALHVGQEWITQNLSTDPRAGQLREDTPDPGIHLSVAVDGLLNQALIYEIPFNPLVLKIDARTGAVVGSDAYTGIGSGLRTGALRTGKARETLWPVRMRTADPTDLGQAAIATQDQVYLWEGYLKSLGIHATQTGNKLRLSKNGTAIEASISDHASTDGTQVWRRQNSYYLPLSLVRKLAPEVEKLASEDTIILNIPPTPVVQQSKRAPTGTTTIVTAEAP